MAEKKPPGLPSWMPTVITLNGLGMAWWEVARDHLDRPYLLLLVGALCSGTPAQVFVVFLNWLSRRNGGTDA